MDAFYGCYRTKPNCQYFAGFYVLLRILNLLLYSTMRGIIYFCCAGYLVTFTLVFVAIVRPYRKKWHNIITDIVLLISFLCYYLYVNMVFELYYLNIEVIKSWPRKLLFANVALITSILALYGFSVLFWKIMPKCLVVKIKLLSRHCSCWIQERELEDSLPHRLELNNEHSTLIH